MYRPCLEIRASDSRRLHVMPLISRDSVDKVMYNVATHKLRTQALAVRAGRFDSSSTAARAETLRLKEGKEVI